jgi:hypothetical protein
MGNISANVFCQMGEHGEKLNKKTPLYFTLRLSHSRRNKNIEIILETNAIIPTIVKEKKGIDSINRLRGQTLLTTILEATYSQTMRELTQSVKNKAFLILMFSLSFFDSNRTIIHKNSI